MKTFTLKTLTLLSLCAITALSASPAMASSDGREAERARTALAAGDILPLSAVLQRLSAQHPGHVLEAELDLEQNRWVYEIKLLPPQSGVVRLELDARDASVLQRREERRWGTPAPAAQPATPAAAPATPLQAN